MPNLVDVMMRPSPAARGEDGKPSTIVTAGDAAYRRGDYAYAYRILKRPAAAGDSDAQCLVGLMNRDGQGIAKNPEEGVRLLRLSADQGNPRAMNELATSYEQGLGVTADSQQALKWYRQAAEFGQPNALHTLAGRYLQGDGVPRDPSESYYLAALAYRFYEPGTKRDEVAQMMKDAESEVSPDARAAIERRVGEFKPNAAKLPPAPIKAPVTQEPAMPNG